MNQKIFIQRGEGMALARIFGVTKGCVSTALSFKKTAIWQSVSERQQ